MDAEAISVSEQVEKSKESRKNLGTATKDFKKLSNEEKIAQFSKLLKQYQTEIDDLTRRSL